MQTGILTATAVGLVASVMGLSTAMAQDGQSQQEYVGGDEVTVLMGFKPGGGSDALAQLVQPFLAEEMGVSFVNQYQPGAVGAIAWTQLAKQIEPDGETISITNTPMLMTNYIMNDAITYDISELTPIANIVTDPGVVVVAKDSPYKNFEDLINAAKENPGTVTVGNSGVGGDDWFSTIMLSKEAGVEFQKVPFQGDGPSWTAAMGGKIDASFNNVGITYPQIEAGNLRPLVVFAEERLPALPDVPTAKELGYDVVAGSSRGYSAPAGLSEEARMQLANGLQRVTENPEFQKAAKDRAMNIDYMGPEKYTAYLQDQEQRFIDVWNEIKDEVQGSGS
nr:tripartite tricarboxylate transporter substrate binding protein [uncultured Halomonas sp.]